jgi:hypothetical protein
MRGTFEVVALVLEGFDDSEQLLVVRLVALFGVVKLPTPERDRMLLSVVRSKLRYYAIERGA